MVATDPEEPVLLELLELLELELLELELIEVELLRLALLKVEMEEEVKLAREFVG